MVSRCFWFCFQLCKNTKADAIVKDLYVENAQLLKALEMTEQRQKTAEKKNYLLEEKIAEVFSNIVRNLTPAPLTSTPPFEVIAKPKDEHSRIGHFTEMDGTFQMFSQLLLFS